MQCGGMKKTTKMKKMQKGGMKTTVANKNDKTFIAGMPNSGPTGPNYQGINTMQKGGTKKKLTKAQAGAAVPSGTMMSDGRVYADKKYKPKPPVSSAIPAGTKMSDGRTWDGKRYVQKGGVSGYMKGVSNAVKKKIVDSPVKPMGPDRPAPKPMMAKTGGSKKKLAKAQNGAQVKDEFRTPGYGRVRKSEKSISEVKPINNVTDNPNKIIDRGVLKTKYNPNKGKTVEKRKVARSVSGPDISEDKNDKTFAKITTRTVKDNLGQVTKEKQKVKSKGSYAGYAYQQKGGVMKAKFGASVSVQRSPKAGKVRSASAQGYSAVGKREPGRALKKTITKKK